MAFNVKYRGVISTHIIPAHPKRRGTRISLGNRDLADICQMDALWRLEVSLQVSMTLCDWQF
jgi:hypothetical protein